MEFFMEFFRATELVVPLAQMLLLLMLSTICLFLRRIKLGLLVNYIFVLYWGFLCNQDFLARYTSRSLLLTIIYFGLGMALIIIAVISFFCEGR